MVKSIPYTSIIDSKTAQSMMVPPPCLAAGIVFSGFESRTFTPLNIFSFWPKSSIFVFSDYKAFLQKVFGSSILEQGLLSVHGNVKLTPLWTVTLVFQMFSVHDRFEPWSHLVFFWQIGDTSELHVLIIVWSDDLGICSCFEMARRDLPNFCKSTILRH